MISAIITGAGGFVGQAVVRELLARGVKVIAVIHSEHSSEDELEGARLIACDMANYKELPFLVANDHPEVFYHFAWDGTAGALRSDERVQLANVQGACDAVRAAAALGCRRFVFASSIMQYEVEVQVRAMQSPSINAIYSTAKMAADYMARIIAAHCGLEYISSLISNIYGPGERSPRLINSSIRKLMRGEHLSLSPCEQMYDFIYITDAAKMLAAIGDKGKAGRTYYIGNCTPHPLKEYMEQLRSIVAPEARLGYGDLPFGEGLTYKEFDTELFYQDISFEPTVSFIEGIRNTRDWIEREDMR